MRDAAPLVNGTDAATRPRDEARRSTYRPPRASFADLEAERDALRDLMKRATTTQFFLRSKLVT